MRLLSLWISTLLGKWKRQKLSSTKGQDCELGHTLGTFCFSFFLQDGKPSHQSGREQNKDGDRSLRGSVL